MKSYVNNICKLVVVCCLFGSVFADLGSNAETAKIKSVVHVINKECRNNIDIINGDLNTIARAVVKGAITIEDLKVSDQDHLYKTLRNVREKLTRNNPHDYMANSSRDCVDTDNGATDAYGDGCAGYTSFPSWCGGYDDDDFNSLEMCCACGGGSAGGGDDGSADDGGDDVVTEFV